MPRQRFARLLREASHSPSAAPDVDTMRFSGPSGPSTAPNAFVCDVLNVAAPIARHRDLAAGTLQVSVKAVSRKLLALTSRPHQESTAALAQADERHAAMAVVDRKAPQATALCSVVVSASQVRSPAHHSHHLPNPHHSPSCVTAQVLGEALNLQKKTYSPEASPPSST